MTAFIILLLVNLLIVLIYLVVQFIRRASDPFHYISQAIIMLLCPVIAPLFYFFAWIKYTVFRNNSVDLEDVIFSKDRVKVDRRADEERERNLVPMEEALSITDKSNLRTHMMNVVKGDYSNSLAEIAMALDSDDSETAHYAASVLQDVINDFRRDAGELYQKCTTNDEEQLHYCKEYIGVVNPILRQKFLTDVEQGNYINQLHSVYDITYELDPYAIGAEEYETLAMRLLDIKDYKNCKLWCKRGIDYYPETLEPYRALLKLYFSINDRERFKETIQELKASNISMDAETLEMLRTFQE